MQSTVSEAVVGYYQENGFVAIPDVLTPGEVKALAESMEEGMQIEAAQRRTAEGPRSGPYYRVLNQRVNVWRDHGGIGQVTLSRSLAELARQLAGVSGIRLFHDHLLWKMPEDSKPTPWHQDLPFWPFDEPRALSVWIPVDDVDEANGCMMFVPKSQEAGKLKGINLVDPDDIFAEANRVGRRPVDRPVIARLRAGSVTFHSGLTFHYGHANQSAMPRRVLAIIYMPDGTRYTGNAHVVTDGAGLNPGDPFHGGLFPLLSSR